MHTRAHMYIVIIIIIITIESWKGNSGIYYITWIKQIKPNTKRHILPGVVEHACNPDTWVRSSRLARAASDTLSHNCHHDQRQMP